MIHEKNLFVICNKNTNMSGGQPVFLFRDLQPNAVQNGFMSAANARFLQSQVEEALTRATGVRVVVPLDDQFVQQMLQIVNLSLAPPPGALGLSVLNRTFIQQYIELQYMSIRQAALYDKYFLSQDRMRTMPYGEYQGDQSVVVSPSQYMMTHPWKKRQASFLNAALSMNQTSAAALPGENPPGAMFYVPHTYCRFNKLNSPPSYADGSY